MTRVRRMVLRSLMVALLASAFAGAPVAYALVSSLIDGIELRAPGLGEPGSEGLDILSYSWGVTNATDFHTGGGGSTSRPSFSELSVTRWSDANTAALLRHAATGEILPALSLTSVRRVNGRPEELIRMTLRRVIVTSVQLGASKGAEASESVTFAFDEVEYVSGRGQFRWNVSANR